MLRAAVFTAVDEHERRSGVEVPNPKAGKLARSYEGRLGLQLVGNFLEHYNLDQTLSVLKAEAGMVRGSERTGGWVSLDRD